MAVILRGVKVGGNRSYSLEVASGFDLIRETEVDLDFDNIYGEFNGKIDNTNIKELADIDYTKLDLLGKIQGTDLDPNIHLPPGTVISGGTGTYPSGSIPPSALQPISIAQLAPGASVQALASVSLSAVVPITSPNTETLCLELTWTSRGPAAHWFVYSSLHALVGITTSPPNISVGSALRYDGTAGLPTDGQYLSTAVFGDVTRAPVVPGFPVVLPFTLTNGAACGAGTSLPTVLPAAGVHRLKLTATIGGQVSVLVPAIVQTGFLMICELA